MKLYLPLTGGSLLFILGRSGCPASSQVPLLLLRLDFISPLFRKRSPDHRNSYCHSLTKSPAARISSSCVSQTCFDMSRIVPRPPNPLRASTTQSFIMARPFDIRLLRLIRLQSVESITQIL